KGRYQWDSIRLKLPVLGNITKKSTIARFTRTLGTLFASGVPVLEALAIVKNAIGNEVLTKAIDQVYESIREGDNFSDPLAASELFDDLVINMVDVGEETGELDKMLLKIADQYEMEVEIAVDGLTAAIEPLLIVFMGGSVGFIVISLFMPLVSIMTNLNPG
ncbi:MAG: type II secretion system F family protein, partial [Planctomycetes bacterium]|nr:type II secretion system F family protein [Planctomycetota bacterium]